MALKKNFPLISIVILNYNGEKWLRKFFHTIYNQTYPNLEWILVDNASKDGSVKFIQENFPKVKIIKNKKNLGVPEGNNSGIRYAKGEFIVLFPNDVEVESTCVEELYNFMKNHPKAGMGTCKVVYYQDPSIINSAGTLIMPDFFTINRGIGERDIGQFERAEEVFGTYTAAIYRRKVFEEAGLFDGDYFVQRDEDDLSMKARMKGWKCYYIPKARVAHVRSPSTGGVGSLAKLYYGERNRLWNLIKYLPLQMMIPAFLFTFKRFFYLAKLWTASPSPVISKVKTKTPLIKILFVLLRTGFDTLLHLPKLLQKRRRIFRNSSLSIREIQKIFQRFSAPLESIEKLYHLPFHEK